jgi:predicted aldo/keto reductase-like oxidoreductase
METRKGHYTRREFLARAGAISAGTIIGASSASTANQAIAKKNQKMTSKVPTRPFGKTGVDVSVLSLGGIIDTSYNQLLLDQALKRGVTYWDTAESYLNGRSEEGMGEYFAKNPGTREKIFLVTKTQATDPDDLTKALEGSLERLQTSYVDLYFLHAISDVNGWLDNSVRKWMEKKKASGMIKFFGISTHDNMEQCLMDATKLGWIDGIMTTYNYRIMHTDRMKAAINACEESGIGITAMKTQARSQYFDMGEENQKGKELTERFLKKGFTLEQARLKAVWENPKIASICSQMPSMTILMANIAATGEQVQLSKKDRKLLKEYGRTTESHYCAGCSQNCEPVLMGKIPIAEVMRFLMYARSYGERERASKFFKKIPSTTRREMVSLDYTKVEEACPRRMPIGSLIREASKELA